MKENRQSRGDVVYKGPVVTGLLAVWRDSQEDSGGPVGVDNGGR